MKTQRIAVVGASTHREKFGNKAVRAYHHAGWEVFPVHPRAASIEGLKAYPSLAEVPGDVDRISVYLPPATTHSLLDDFVAKGTAELWLNPGASNPGVSAAARAAGLPVVDGCSIVAIGLSPGQFP